MNPWLAATRPKTLAAGLVPVAVGTALAGSVGAVRWDLAAGCLVGALLIQIGCNFANDAFDALKGADTAERIGPQRAVAAGLISPRAMLIATGVVLTAALGVGLWLAGTGGWPILVLGLISLICAVGYTAGPFPLAYIGLGDLFVFLFFGWFAVLGTAWILAGRLPLTWWLVASAVGLQAATIICVNNLRDIPTDAKVGKRTLCVRLGDRASRAYYGMLHAGAALCLLVAATQVPSADQARYILPAGLAAMGGMLLARGVAKAQGAELNGFLGKSAGLELLTGVALVILHVW